ncbi:MAG: 1-phosphofructokinase family hexose kinase [Candidatus Omnitrophica bacterium]|nr:1-phosphofructokinase family hexose kinase [Candidatus Omnitrophota bacterium]
MHSSAYILTVTLNPALDKIVKVPDFKTGKDHRAKGFVLSAGGKGLNVSRALVLFDCETLATGIVGGNAGERVIHELHDEGIENDFLKIQDETRTNLTIIDPHTGMITRLIERGPKLTGTAFTAFMRKFDLLLGKASYVVCSGSNAYGLPEVAYGELIARAKKRGVPVALDTRGRSLMAALKRGPSLVKPNLEEAEYALGRKLDTIKKIKQAAHYLRDKSGAIVLITMDARGAVGYDGNEVAFAKAPHIKCVNDVGCGDVFLAAFISAQGRRRPFKESIAYATRMASYSARTEKPGMM